MSRPHGVQPDPGAALELYDVALPEVYGYLLQRCRRPSVAEDLTAETFLAAVQAVRDHPPDRPTTGWLIGIARHKLVDHWRRAEREERGLRAVARTASADRGDTPPALGRPETPGADAHLDRIVARDVLAGLGAHHRTALTLRYLDGLAVAQVAEHLGRTLHATEALLVRARSAFRRGYSEAGGHHD